jgi:hypothetical protein
MIANYKHNAAKNADLMDYYVEDFVNFVKEAETGDVNTLAETLINGEYKYVNDVITKLETLATAYTKANIDITKDIYAQEKFDRITQHGLY